MEYTELQLSENTTGELSSDNPFVQFAKSRLGALFLTFVALLYPMESFSANCALTAAPVCIDSTPCKTVVDSAGNNVLTCLSTAPTPPPSALVTSLSCWQYKAAYNCINGATPTYKDTCTPIKNGGTCKNYAELSSICNATMPVLPGGACPLFDVTYQCEIAPGTPYADTTCGSKTACVDANGNPSFCTQPLTAEKNTGFGKLVAAQEAARQTGVYAQKGLDGETDPNKIFIFKGEPNRCAEGLWGQAKSCCNPIDKGASVTNALITEQLVAAGWNQIAKNYAGSDYMYDNLIDDTMAFLKKALEVMQEVVAEVQNGSTVVAAVQANATAVAAGARTAGAGTAAAAAGTGAVFNIATGVGGAVGGVAGGMVASQYAAKNGFNTAWAGTFTAVGTAAGTVGGAYLAGAGYGAVAGFGAGAAAAGGAAGASAGGAFAASAAFGPALVAVLVIAIIMSFAACTPEDMKTQLKLGAPRICHYVGSYCNKPDGLGGCITTMQSHCCFNSRLARIIQEGAKNQIPALGGWGQAKTPNCAGLKVADLANIDFSKIDFTEFEQDVVAKTKPIVADVASKVQSQTQAFIAANPLDPTATAGVLVTGANNQLPKPTVPAIAGANYPPSLSVCAVAFKVTGMLADGTQTGRFDVSQCNPGALIAWDNKGNCAGSQPTSLNSTSPNFITSLVDTSGNANISFTLPPACFVASSPAIQNMWKGMVTLAPHGSLGAIDAVWQ